MPSSAATSILVTGGAGFMGSHLVQSVLNEPQLDASRVVVLDDLSGGSRDQIPDDPRVEFVAGSITDTELVESLFQEHRFRYVYHLAAYAAEGLSHFIRHFNYTNNLLGSVNLINRAVRFETRCFIFTSSIAVYGAGPPPLREEQVPHPVDPYGIAKYAVELDLAAAGEMYGLNYVIFRPHNVYGEHQNLGDRYRNVVGIFMNRLMQGRPMPIFGDGTQRRAFSYIRDVSPAIARAPLVPAANKRTFNVGSDVAITVNELAERVAIAMGVPARTEHLPPRHEVHVAYSDHAAVRRVFPDLGETALDEGLRNMADWARTATIRPSQRFDSLDIERGLPPSWRDP